jgi:ABC-2 type transport system ATP-binding protein
VGVAISCTAVCKRFGPVEALRGLDLTVPEGTIVGVLGPNGAGKSTTIRILLDLARPDGGEVRVLGSDPRAGGPALRRRLGYLPGELRLDDRLTVEETLRSWARIRDRPLDEPCVGALCERLDLDRSRATRTLSSGNRRKVGLVGAFMARPELLVLDEPTSGVDPLVQEQFRELVVEARDEGRTVFLSSHVLGEVQRVADEVVVVRAGVALVHRDVDELRQAARQPFTAWFDGAPPETELRAVPGVTSLEVRGNEVAGVLEGRPDGLLGVLARHPVTHLLMPEPDLEDAFLQLYAGTEQR